MLSLLAEPLKIMNVPNTDMVGMHVSIETILHFIIVKSSLFVGDQFCGFPGLPIPRNVSPHQLLTIQLIVLH